MPACDGGESSSPLAFVSRAWLKHAGSRYSGRCDGRVYLCACRLAACSEGQFKVFRGVIALWQTEVFEACRQTIDNDGAKVSIKTRRAPQRASVSRGAGAPMNPPRKKARNRATWPATKRKGVASAVATMLASSRQIGRDRGARRPSNLRRPSLVRLSNRRLWASTESSLGLLRCWRVSVAAFFHGRFAAPAPRSRACLLQSSYSPARRC